MPEPLHAIDPEDEPDSQQANRLDRVSLTVGDLAVILGGLAVLAVLGTFDLRYPALVVATLIVWWGARR